MINVVGYARYSSDNQREESILAQVRAIEEFCSRNGYNLTKIYKDEATSGTSTNGREEYLSLIEDSKKKQFQAVIVHKFDRFARNRYDHAIYEKKLNDNGVKLISVLEQLNDSPESVILKSVLTGMNEYYSLNLSREVKKGLKENALKCIHTGGIPPLGYDVGEDKKYTINEVEAESVRIIFRLYLQDVGYRRIAEYLNKEGRVNKRGNPFKMISIRDTLLNEKYTGVYVFGKKDAHGRDTGKEIRIDGGMPQIIEKEIFFKAQKKMKNKRTGGRCLAITPYYLTGVCTCGECGKAFTGGYRTKNRNGTYYYGYICSGRKSKGSNCKNKSIRKELLENLVFNTIKDEILTDDAIKEITNLMEKNVKEIEKRKNKNSENIEREILHIKGKKEKILNLYLEGNIEKELYQKKTNELNNQVISLELEMEKYKNLNQVSKEKIIIFLKEIRKNMKKDEIKKSVVETFVKSVEVTRTNVKITLKKIPFKLRVNGGSDGN